MCKSTIFYKSTNVAETIKRIAKSKDIQLKDMLIELQLNKNTLSNMYKGSMLKGDSLARIADYLDCSVDYLLGRTDEQTSTPYTNNINDTSFNNFMQGNIIKGNTSISSASENKSKNLSQEETEILEIYRSLNISDKSAFLNFILDMKKEN